MGLGPDDHHFGGFDESGCCIALFESQLARRIGGDDRRDALIADCQDDFGEKTFDFDLHDCADKLVTSADSRPGSERLRRGKKPAELAHGNAVVTAGSFDGLDAASKDPVLERRIAYAEPLGGLARSEDLRGNHIIDTNLTRRQKVASKKCCALHGRDTGHSTGLYPSVRLPVAMPPEYSEVDSGAAVHAASNP